MSGDKADNAACDAARLLADTAVRLVPFRQAHQRPKRWADRLTGRACRKRSESLSSQLAALGVQRLRARANCGL